MQQSDARSYRSLKNDNKSVDVVVKNTKSHMLVQFNKTLSAEGGTLKNKCTVVV